MEISCQFALYPLGVAHLGPAIDVARAALLEHGLVLEPGPMSTLVRGQLDDVFAGLADAFRAASDGGVVLVATVSNACPVEGAGSGELSAALAVSTARLRAPAARQIRPASSGRLSRQRGPWFGRGGTE
ncbi:MAG TPA: YkoF family thiamine/hydroxymethylpyrimidine-binding protein [Streptosporangiaceae bacterium]|nr:YkoF family thiamine/hydroxymethylpyrimidine-binding protein [Streptosporangiaceae bacterium]